MESATQLAVRQPPTTTRRHRSLEERRHIVEETLVPGASIARVARAHGVNANLLFHWRKLYRAGLLQAGGAPLPAASTGCVQLLPVTIDDAVPTAPPAVTTRPAIPTEPAPVSGTIELRLAKAHICVSGTVDVNTLRAVLEFVLR